MAAPGRPRTFEIESVLAKAIEVFTANGYHGTSINDLTKALNLTAGSLYKAFKDKRHLFLLTLDYYKNQRNKISADRMAKATNGRDKLRCLLAGYAEDSYGKQGEIGCMVISTAVELTCEDPEICKKIHQLFTSRIQMIYKLIVMGQEDGSISTQIAPQKVAETLHCITQGMRVIGKSGTNKDHLENIVMTSMTLLN